MNDSSNATGAAKLAEHAADAARDVAAQATDIARSEVKKARESVSAVVDGASEAIQKYPVRTAMIAAGVVAVAGFVVGFLFARRG